jgi:hypothetical protein
MIFLFLHNLFRWLVVLSGLWVLFRVWTGFLKHSEWTNKERIAGLVFTSLLNLQFLLGILVLFLGPLHAVSAYSHMGEAMKNPVLRFFAIEHPFMMLLAVIVAQAGFSLSKRAATDRAKFLRATICYTISAILIVAAVPWPFSKVARPLFPTLLGQECPLNPPRFRI